VFSNSTTLPPGNVTGDKPRFINGEAIEYVVKKETATCKSMVGLLRELIWQISIMKARRLFVEPLLHIVFILILEVNFKKYIDKAKRVVSTAPKAIADLVFS
jgi:hypothetical protein